MQLVAELPLVPRICTLSCETHKQREWRSVFPPLMKISHAQAPSLNIQDTSEPRLL